MITLFGSYRKLGVPYFGVLIVRILLFRGAVLGSPRFGNPIWSTAQELSDLRISESPTRHESYREAIDDFETHLGEATELLGLRVWGCELGNF